MTAEKLYERLYQEIESLSEQKLQEILLFIEFLKMREDKEFIEYVNGRTQQALNERKDGKKFYRLEDLQREFSRT